MLENFDGIHVNYKVGLQRLHGYFCLMFLHYMSVGLGIGYFFENFSSELRKNDQIGRNNVSKLYSGYIPHYQSPILTHATTIVPLPLVNPHHQYENSIKKSV